jgi:hypothetical protein
MQVTSRAQTGLIEVSTNPSQIRGDTIYGQYFHEKIDEITSLEPCSNPERHDYLNNTIALGSTLLWNSRRRAAKDNLIVTNWLASNA